jgi:ferredoxin--NADP+ reductase
MRRYHVAVVGSGPSAFFAAASLLKAADASEEFDVAVDMLEMLPTLAIRAAHRDKRLERRRS